MKYIHAFFAFALLLSMPLAAQKKAVPASKPQKSVAGNKATKPSVAANRGPDLVEKVVQKPGQLIIPFEKYILPNGLVVVIHEDHSDPVVHVDVTYHTGSAREQLSKSGFAHFFEHMMFQGSDNVADEEHFKLVNQAGGTLNGTTNRDRTNYFETLPSNQLETALWLEADRMGFLLDAVTQKKFEVQRATVKNERNQNYDNRPYGLAGEYISRALYPYGHPYSWLTIGYIEDLNRVNVEDLKDFFLRWYGPNNATITIGGDINTKDALNLVQKYFGPIARGPVVKAMKPIRPKVEKDRYISFQDKIRMPRLMMSWPTVERSHPDEAAIDCLAEIIGGGTTSLFHKNLVKTQKATSAYAYQSNYELSGEFSLMVNGYPTTNLADMEKIVRATLTEFEARGVTDKDIVKFKSQSEASTIRSLETVSGKVSQLASYQTFTGSPNQLPNEIKRLQSLKKEDVMRVYNQYIKNKFAVILSIVPNGKNELVAAPDNFKPDSTNYIAGPNEYVGMKYVKAKDNFDRSKKPLAGKNPSIIIPDFWTDKYTNGIKLMGAKNTELPLTTVYMRIKGGHHFDSRFAGRNGLSYLTASLMNESTQKYSSEQISEALQKMGSYVSVYPSDDAIIVSISSLSKNLRSTLNLAEEKLFRPKFDQQEFDRLKNEQIEEIADQKNKPAEIADIVFDKLIYGNNNALGSQSIGTEASVKAITLQEVQEFYKQYLSPTQTDIVVVSDLSKEELSKQLGFLHTWTSPVVEQLPVINLDAVKTAASPILYLVDKPGAAQSQIKIGYRSFAYDATGTYYRAKLANYTLGGNFNSRINLNLREDKGYTYGASSGFYGSDQPGYFQAAAAVKSSVTDSALIEFVKEMELMAKRGITSQELDYLKSSIGQSEARKYEASSQKAAFLSLMIRYNLPKTYIDEQNKILKNITIEEINTISTKLFDINQMSILVVGDAASIRPGLAKLGYPMVELDLDGMPIMATDVVMPLPVVPDMKQLAKPIKNK